MPYILTNPASRSDAASLDTVRYKYKYPMGLDLRPTSDLHKRLVTEIMTRSQTSRDVMSTRYDNWGNIDHVLTGYIEVSEKDKRIKEMDPNKPIPIVFPLSYAAMETVLTYLVSAFLDYPIFRYEGFGGEDVLGAVLLERVVELQTRRTYAGLALHTMFRDSLAYGFGCAAPAWIVKMGRKRTPKKTPLQNLLGIFVSDVEVEDEVKFEGNEIYNIDPYNYLPDPNTPVHDVQKSGYVGWVLPTNRMNLLRQERIDSAIFNCKYLKHIDGRSVLGSDKSKRDVHRTAPLDDVSDTSAQRVDVIWQYIDIIPSDSNWRVGRKDYPEKWLFGLAGDSLIISAHPCGLDHDMYPVVICAPEYDGYSMTPLSKVESVFGLQTLIDFLFNSHVTNVRKALNDMFVVDPQRINILDVLNPAAGRVIRTRQKAWGTGVKDAIEQLKVTDVTASHIGDAGVVTDILDRVMGSESSIRGEARSSGERVSATEYQGYKGAALSRIGRTARIAAMQSIDPLGYMMASHTQQFMSTETYVSIAGEMEEELRKEFGDEKRHLVGPLDILVRYNILTHDGALPTSGDAQSWLAAMQVIGTNPDLLATFDIVRIFKYWAKLSGAKNIGQFVGKSPNISAKVVQDEELLKEKEKGNVVSVEEA